MRESQDRVLTIGGLMMAKKIQLLFVYINN